LLALSYARFVAHLAAAPRGAQLRHNPSGYIESQGGFANRFATAMRARSALACELELMLQSAFPEPSLRVNSEPAEPCFPNWSEPAAWDGIAAFYELPPP
jgi:hypothetical protein